jgi:hypothetical protein
MQLLRHARLGEVLMLNIRQGLVVLGCVFVGFAASAGPGIVASAAEPERWVQSAIGAGPGDAQRHVAQLEQRLKELEAERRDGARVAATPGQVPSEPSVIAQNQVLAQNQELIARNRALAAENRALTQSHLFEPPVAAPAACEPAPDGADPKAQLRYWAERLREGENGFRGGLTPEQNAALNVLLRHERSLDPHNPWKGH